MKAFNTLPLSEAALQVVAELGYEKMTEIQEKSIPLILAGRDIVGQSKTGSGKTAAFTLPILEKINPEAREVQALVLCPTRELCTQVAREIRKLGRRHTGLQVLIVSGGLPFPPQADALYKGVHIVVGTPGRVLDHLNRRTMDLTQVYTLVLDEADRMLDMGFQEDMEQILSATPPDRQTIFFSATFPRTIEAMSQQYQKDPSFVTITEEQVTASNIEQNFYLVEPENKYKALLKLIQQNKPDSAIVFCNLKVNVIELEKSLRSAGMSVACIHGDLEQNDRDRVMAKFRNRSTRVLIATDVAARGIDIENLDLVVNFELPSNEEVYVHRIGRTGRAGKSGLAISLVTLREKGKMERIGEYAGINPKLQNLSLREEEVEAIKQDLPRDASMVTLYISGGRKEKMRPGDILGALTGDAAGLKGTDIGKIEIHDHFSYVAISKNVAAAAIESLREGKIKGRKFRVELVK